MKTCFNRAISCAIFLLVLSNTAFASVVSPTADIWIDATGNLIYQTPIKHVTLVDDITPSLRLYDKFPYAKIVLKDDGSYNLIKLSSKEFKRLESELVLFGKRIQGDFDGDGLPDILIQTDAGDEILVSKKLARKFTIGTDLNTLSSTSRLLDLNRDLRLDIVDTKAQTVQYALSDGFSFAIDTNNYVGALPAKSNVSPSGEFTYNIPIVTGESTGGLKPNISISYMSSPVNGHVGIGWSIGGLGAITRCEQNKETDNQVTLINFTSSDRFCLDGQRLIVKAGQAYGSNGSEYRLVQDSGQKIIAYTSNETMGPDFFKVYDTQGNSVTYGKLGSSIDANITATNGKVFAWAIKKVQDVSGNYYQYTYNQVKSTLEFYVEKVDYSGNGSVTKNKISFQWEDRPDNNKTTYLYNQKITLTKRLKQIDSFYNNNLIRKYKLKYKHAYSNVQNQSRLESISACDSKDKCISPTLFKWNDHNRFKFSTPQSKEYSHNSRYKAHQYLDFNGDGYIDIAYVRNDQGSSTDHLYMIPGSASGFLSEKRFYNMASKIFRKTWKIADLDKDGKDDILYLNWVTNSWHVLKHQSAMNFSTAAIAGIPKPNSDGNSRFFDIDGDGHPELIHIINNRLTAQKGTKIGLDSTPHPLIFSINRKQDTSTSLVNYDREDNTFSASDFNGDGRADFLVQIKSVHRETTGCDFECPEFSPKSIMALSSKSPVITSKLKTTNSSSLQKTDLIFPELAKDNTLISKARALRAAPEPEPPVTTTSYSWRIMTSDGNNHFSEFLDLGSTSKYKEIFASEINGDGLTDIVYKTTGDNWYVLINNGLGFENAIFVVNEKGQNLKFVDVNNDGIKEAYRNVNGDLFYFLHGNKFTAYRMNNIKSDYWATNFIDITGDGVVDRVKFSGRLWWHKGLETGADKIQKITNGFGAETKIIYSTLNNHSVHVPDNDANSKSWGNFGRITDLKGAIPVVYQLSKNRDTLTYKYFGGKAQVGRGLLGYKKVSIESYAASSKIITTYRQDGIYRGSVTNVDTFTKFGIESGDGGGEEPCIERPELCECDGKLVILQAARAPDDCDHLRLVKNTPSTSTAANKWRLKSSANSSYLVKRNPNFKIGSYTTSSFVYPNRTHTTTYNTDNDNLEVLATETNTNNVDAFGNSLYQRKVIASQNGDANTSKTSVYDYGYYGGRVTKLTTNKTYKNESGGTNKGSKSVSFVNNFTYDSKGRLHRKTADNGVVTTFNLIDSVGLLQSQVVSASGLPTTTLATAYDANYQHVTSETNSIGHQGSTVYDSLGRKYYSQTVNGQRTYSQYNSLGRLISKVIAPANSNAITSSLALTTSKSQYWCQSIAHCPSSAVYFEEIITEGKPATRTYYNVYGDKLRTSAKAFSGNNWVNVDITYDSKGRKVNETTPYFSNVASSASSAITYDQQNRTIKIVKPDDSEWTTSYDGLSVTSTNPNGSVNTQTKNAMGLLISVTDANSQSATYLYDANGKSTDLIDPNGNIIRVEYDKYGNKTKIIDPDKGTITYEYNAYHQLIKQTDARSNQITTTYDNIGRPVRRDKSVEDWR